MSQENLELAQRVLGHWTATGELLWDTAHPEVELHDHDAPDQGDYRGPEGLERWLQDWGEAWAEWTMDLDEFIDAGDSVVIFVRMKARGRGSGIDIDRRDALVYEIRESVITRIDYSNDRAQALKAVGLEESRYRRSFRLRDTGRAMAEESTTPDLVELVRHLLHAASRMGGDGFVRFFAPDAVFLTGVGRFEGREAIRGYIEDFNSSYDEQSFTPDEVHDLGNGVAWFSAVVTGRLRGTSSDVHLRFAVVVTHAGGVVSQWTDYATIDEARAAAERLVKERG